MKARLLLLAPLLAALSLSAGRQERDAAADRARASMKAGKFEQAAAAWEQALGPDASDRELKEGLSSEGRCYEALKNYQKALTAYQRALQFAPKDVDRVLDLARVYGQVDLNREALELYRRALTLDKTRHDAVLASAVLSLKTGEWDEARRLCQTYIDWEPRDPAGQRLMAQIEEASGELAAAGARWDVLASKDPSPEAYYSLGRLWVRAGRWDQAEAAFAQAEGLGCRTGSLYLYEGVIRWLKDDAPQAKALWRKALEKHPGLGAAHFFLALASRDGGDKAGARAEAALAAAGAQGDLLKTLARDILDDTKGTR